MIFWIILAALIFGVVSCSNSVIDDIPVEGTVRDNLKSAKGFCPKIDNCLAYSWRMFIDTCPDIDLSEWKVNTGEKVYYLELGELDSRKYVVCFKGKDVGQNVDHYYCNITLSKETITDDKGNILATNFDKYVGVEYKIESTDDRGLNLLKLVDYSCTYN